MGIAPQQFEGISTRIPGIYTKSEFPPSLGSSGVSGNIVAIVGESLGGIPYNATDYDEQDRVNIFTSVNNAINTLVGDAGMYMTEFYLSPTKDPSLGKPSYVLFFRVNPAVAGSATLQKSSVDKIDLQTTLYGAIANQVSRKVEAGTNIGHKVTVKYKGATYAEEDDIGYEYFEIQYTGTGTACTMTIDADSLETTVTGASGEDLVLNFAEYTKLKDLIAYINEQPTYTATLKGASDANPNTLDAVTTQDIKTSAYTAVALVQALIDFFNNRSGGLITASLSSGATRDDVDNDSNFVFMTSGSDGTTSNSDWTATFELMKKFNINHILVASGDASIHTIAVSHVEEMSKIEEGKNRSLGLGALSSKTIAEKRAEAKALDSARCEYWATPFKRPDVLNNNNSTLFAPFYGAALGAGIRYGNFITISATFKKVNALGVGESYDRQTADAMIGDGCSLLELTERGVVVKHNVTTYQANNLILNYPSMLRTADFITLDSQSKLLTKLANLKRAPSALVIKSIENYLTSVLLPDYVTQGLLTDDPNTGDPAFSDVEFSVVGDRFDFSFTGIIPAPLHFGFIKQKFIIVGYQGG